MSKIGKLVQQTLDAVLQLSDDVAVSATIRPGVYTQQYEDDLIAASAASRSPTGIDDWNRVLLDLVEKWDLDDDKGVIPLDMDQLRERLPLAVAKPLAQAVIRAASKVGEATSSATPS